MDHSTSPDTAGGHRRGDSSAVKAMRHVGTPNAEAPEATEAPVFPGITGDMLPVAPRAASSKEHQMFDPRGPSLKEAKPPAHRGAIDNVATLRSRAIRIALFARLILHPPAGTDTVLLDQYREVLNAQVAEMQEVRAILEGQRAGTMPQWIAGIAKAHASDVARISDLVDISQAIADALAGDKSEVESLLAEHFKRGRGGFFESVTSICNALWADVDAERQAALARTAADAAHISATLARMERIGKHVRLVALNASVEAARAGDAGKGLGVIAHEFKSLAEEIQRLAITARSHADTAPD